MWPGLQRNYFNVPGAAAAPAGAFHQNDVGRAVSVNVHPRRWVERHIYVRRAVNLLPRAVVDGGHAGILGILVGIRSRTERNLIAVPQLLFLYSQVPVRPETRVAGDFRFGRSLAMLGARCCRCYKRKRQKEKMPTHLLAPLDDFTH